MFLLAKKLSLSFIAVKFNSIHRQNFIFCKRINPLTSISEFFCQADAFLFFKVVRQPVIWRVELKLSQRIFGLKNNWAEVILYLLAKKFYLVSLNSRIWFDSSSEIYISYLLICIGLFVKVFTYKKPKLPSFMQNKKPSWISLIFIEN